ncbi:unnamed protein product [Sphenostylis stenocarpa]|uniref:Uncharacterized protein n=1 Tax=Sphenostylis stenocarpa TaxID=92480 RepID=A0AA86TAH3_9FABA|nr:unnamed protein product [Sphenostylis stenocarpa]
MGRSEVLRIRDLFIDFNLPGNDFLGPYEIVDFILLDLYRDVSVISPSSGISKGALTGIVLGAIAFLVTLSAIVMILIWRIRLRYNHTPSKRPKAMNLGTDKAKKVQTPLHCTLPIHVSYAAKCKKKIEPGSDIHPRALLI